MVRINLPVGAPMWVVSISLAGVLLIGLVFGLARLTRAAFSQRLPNASTGGRLADHAYPMTPSRSARAVASEGPYQVSSRPETSTTRWAGNSSGPSPAVNG